MINKLNPYFQLQFIYTSTSKNYGFNKMVHIPHFIYNFCFTDLKPAFTENKGANVISTLGLHHACIK